MSTDARGGLRNNQSGYGIHYQPKSGQENNPVIFVDWFSTLRYVNWVHNGQAWAEGMDSNTIHASSAQLTENGAYTILGNTPFPTNAQSITRNPGARVFLPTENEWYKAAYYKGNGLNSGYFTYPTKSDSQPNSVNPGEAIHVRLPLRSRDHRHPRAKVVKRDLYGYADFGSLY